MTAGGGRSDRSLIRRFDLERSGRIMGANNPWIAAQGRAGDLTLVTDNVGEFGRIDGLRLEGILRSSSCLAPMASRYAAAA